MKVITKVKTYDGAEHEDGVAAFKHLEKIYSNRLTSIAHALVKEEKYTKIAEWLDMNLDKFIELHRIKGDMAMEQPDQED